MLYSIRNRINPFFKKGNIMTLCEEIYFEINVTGRKSEIKKFVNYLKSGELDEFFEISSDYICYDDNYYEAEEEDNCSMVFTNDDCGIELDELDTDEFLEILCKAGKALDLKGTLYDADDEQYSFISGEGDTYYLNADKIKNFNDELDAHASKEEAESSEDDE